MSDVSSILEWIHEDIIHLQANYIVQVEKPNVDPLKSIT